MGENPKFHSDVDNLKLSERSFPISCFLQSLARARIPAGPNSLLDMTTFGTCVIHLAASARHSSSNCNFQIMTAFGIP